MQKRPSAQHTSVADRSDPRDGGRCDPSPVGFKPSPCRLPIPVNQVTFNSNNSNDMIHQSLISEIKKSTRVLAPYLPSLCPIDVVPLSPSANTPDSRNTGSITQHHPACSVLVVHSDSVIFPRLSPAQPARSSRTWLVTSCACLPAHPHCPTASVPILPSSCA